MPVVQFLNEHISLDVLPGANLRKAALKSGIHLYKPLHRVFHLNLNIGPIKFPCASDVVEIEGKGTNSRSPAEEAAIGGRFLIKRKVAPNLRLACQVTVNGDVTVRTQPKLEIDKDETKRRVGLAAIVTFFVLAMAALLLLIGLDLLQKL